MSDTPEATKQDASAGVDTQTPAPASSSAPSSAASDGKSAGKGESKSSRKAAEKPVPVDAELSRRIEAALLTTDRPLPPAKLSELLDKVGAQAVHEAVQQLNQVYESTGRSFRIEQVAGGYQILTLPDYADVLAAMHKTRSQAKLSPAALETLAIIAYRQPILRAQIETIRGVACGEVLRSLMERHLVKIVGRAEELGRPMLYGTTKAFLEVFGLSSLKDLPKAEELGGK